MDTTNIWRSWAWLAAWFIGTQVVDHKPHHSLTRIACILPVGQAQVARSDDEVNTFLGSSFPALIKPEGQRTVGIENSIGKLPCIIPVKNGVIGLQSHAVNHFTAIAKISPGDGTFGEIFGTLVPQPSACTAPPHTETDMAAEYYKEESHEEIFPHCEIFGKKKEEEAFWIRQQLTEDFKILHK